MATMAQSAASLLHLALLATIHHGLLGGCLAAASWAALATCISPYAVVMMAPVLAVPSQGRTGSVQTLVAFATALLILLTLSWKISGTIGFLRSTYGSLYLDTVVGPDCAHTVSPPAL